MTFIDWSDSEEMIGLLIEYVTDEKNRSHGDKREKFLSGLLRDLTEQRIDVKLLQSIHESIDPEFQNDEVAIHVRDCIEELKRLGHE